MRSGFGPCDEQQDTIASQNLLLKLVSIVTTLVTRAASSAAVYADHAKMNMVEWKSVAMALRYECRRFLSDDIESLEQDVSNTQQKLDEILQGMGIESVDALIENAQQGHEIHDDDEDDTESAYTSTDEDDENDEEGENEEMELVFEPSYSNCECSLCAAITSANKEWDAWVPKDEIETFLKLKTDESIAKVLFSVQ